MVGLAVTARNEDYVKAALATDGFSAMRIEEEVVVTKDGCEIITNFPSDRLISCGLPGCEVF